MSLGEKIKFLRTKEGITQEAMAERLNVSRSAIAKWEAGNGTPEISNLKMISQMFAISLDELLGDACETDDGSQEGDKPDTSVLEYSGGYYDIDLKGWNDGVYDVLVVGEDKDFIFYQKKAKENCLYGLIGKRYITAIQKSRKHSGASERFEPIERNYFCGKPVCIDPATQEGFIKGFFDFRSDDYRDVRIISFTDAMVNLQFGGELSVDSIAKIEVLN